MENWTKLKAKLPCVINGVSFEGRSQQWQTESDGKKKISH